MAADQGEANTTPEPSPVAPGSEAAFCLFAAKCAENKELVAEFNRLTHSSVGAKLTPMQQMVDLATGKMARDIVRFMEFVIEQWKRLPPEARSELETEANDRKGVAEAHR